MDQPRVRKTLLVTAMTICLSPAIAPAIAADDIKVGHLTYHTGEYGAFGDFFDAVTDFSLDVINEDPPLGRRLSVVHQDIGTIGEERAAKRLIGDEQVDVLLNVAHSYLDYRDDVVGEIAGGRDLLLPSVHGGAIESRYGGSAAEPIFRGSPMDTAIGTAALLHAQESGASTVTIVASDIAGAQLQKETALRVADELGISVIDTIDFHSGTADFKDMAGRIYAFTPDAVVVFAPPEESGRLVAAGAEVGDSWLVIGGTELFEPAFVEAAGYEAIEQHKQVVFTGFAHTDGEAWEVYRTAAEGASQAARIGDVSNSYAIQYYDLLVATALAIEKAGSTDPTAWTKAMYAVTGNGGERVHSYADGIAALRAGKDIDYDGVTGTVEYSDTGVVAGTVGIYRWADSDRVEKVDLKDGERIMALAED